MAMQRRGVTTVNRDGVGTRHVSARWAEGTLRSKRLKDATHYVGMACSPIDLQL